jgi:molybdate transport system ATP-binding protein
MSIEVEISQTLGSFTLEAAFRSTGSLTALFGPSGSGKTTLINCIGGLARPSRGRIVAAGRVLVDTEAGVFVPAHKRRIGYVFQDARLFPHLTVSQNLRYGRFFTPAGERYADFRQVVELLGIDHLLDRRPAGLSGGERQRVAIGRALIASPRLILMDEPLASLDEARKAEILPYVERLRDEMNIPIVYVSHSIAEVSRLASDVVMMAGGKVLAVGSVAEIMPQLDLLPVDDRAETGAVVNLELVSHEDEYGLSLLRSSGGEWRLPRVEAAIGARLRVRVRARDVMLAIERPAGISALNVLTGRIAEVTEGAGADALVTIDSGSDRLFARLTRRSVRHLGLAPGREVFAVIKSVTFDRGHAPGG